MTRTSMPSDQMLVDLGERPWAAYAACREVDSNLFFPPGEEDAGAALRICRGCPVVQECREWALDTRMRYGIWGGMTERERRRVLRRSA